MDFEHYGVKDKKGTPMSVTSNLDRYGLIRSGLETLLPFLRDFVHTNLQRAHGSKYRERHEFIGYKTSFDSDPRLLMKIVIDRWESVFRDSPRQIRNHLHLVREIANKLAHHEPITDREACHAVETMQLLAIAISDEHAAVPFDELLRRFPKSGGGKGRETDPPIKVCPACGVMKFKSWPMGWDAHAAFKCKGLREKDPELRKREFRDRFADFFRK